VLSAPAAASSPSALVMLRHAVRQGAWTQMQAGCVVDLRAIAACLGAATASSSVQPVRKHVRVSVLAHVHARPRVRARRYELERGLLEGSVAVADLPRLWNEKMAAYLGCTPEDDGEGVLQARPARPRRASARSTSRRVCPLLPGAGCQPPAAGAPRRATRTRRSQADALLVCPTLTPTILACACPYEDQSLTPAITWIPDASCGARLRCCAHARHDHPGWCQPLCLDGLHACGGREAALQAPAAPAATPWRPAEAGLMRACCDRSDPPEPMSCGCVAVQDCSCTSL